jgi:hypothetical protein
MACGSTYNAPILTGVNVETSFTRPSDTTAYSVSDVLGNTGTAAVLTFAGMADPGVCAGAITKARLMTNSATACLGMAVRLYLYKTAPTPIADNSPYTLLWADRSNRIGYLDFPALATEGTGSDSASALWLDLPVTFTTVAGSGTLYGVLVVKTAGAAPASAQQFAIALNADQY